MTRRRSMPGTERHRPPGWLFLAAGAFLLYFGVIVTAEIFRPGPSGLHVQFDEQGAEVVSVVPGSTVAPAGLRLGDRILTMAGRVVRTREDWFAVSANLVADQPVLLTIDRNGTRLSASFTPVRRELGLTTVAADTVALLASRLVQLAALVLALVIALKRPADRSAPLTTWLLASFGVFTVLLPYGFAHFWRLVPLLLQPLLWVPYLSSFLAPAIFFAFAAEFPRRLFGDRRQLIAGCAPALLVAAWRARVAYVTVYKEARIPIGPDWSQVAGLLSVGYLLAGLVVLIVQYRRLDQVSDRRRLRVLLAGTLLGFGAGALVAGAVLVARLPRFTSSLFAAPLMLVAVPLLAALPASIAYTILRHRMFGVGFIVRQGVRYAMARRLLLSLVPVVLAAFAFDLYLHRDLPIVAMVQMRAWRYVLAGGGLVALILNRGRWLAALDRRFFHEHYRAEQILQEIALQLRHAGDPDAAVAAVVQQIERALHPVFVGTLGGGPGTATLEPLAATPEFPADLRLGRDSRLLALSRAVDRPLDLSPDQDTWIARHLPPAEAALVYDTHVELLVPVTMGPTRDVVLMLGPRRSEEPYSGQDVALLGAIASSLALLLERNAPVVGDEPSLAECPQCGACFDTGHARCPGDGALLLVSGVPRILGGRYRLRSRLGAGGMGTVYSAHDQSLGRSVAIKLLGEHLVGSADAARRFQREAQTAARLTHPHVVTIHDFGITAHSRAFIVMELLEGRTLREELARQGPLAPARALVIVNDVCGVLTTAHGLGLVHRDLKPENIFITTSGSTLTTKVLDFGIAKALADSRGPTATGTSSGVLIGTLAYMSPEQLRGESVHPMWDLWALGVMSLEILTGARSLSPGAEASDEDGAATTHLQRLRDLPPALSVFFADALAHDRRQRPATAQEFAERFSEALRA